jgi:hypothetical protein
MTTDLVVRIIVFFAILNLVFQLANERKFPMASLWVWPAVLFVFVGFDLWATNVSSVLDIAYMIFALLAGTALGWYLGTYGSIRIDKAARAAYLKVTPIGDAIFITWLGTRVGVRYFASGTSAYSSDPNQLSPAAALAFAITLVFAVGLFVGQRLYVKQKYDETPA